jgi:Fe2+ or Zn2+ uptake regulation protein
MDKQIIIKAIESNQTYSESERKVLLELVRISVENIAIASVKELINRTGCATTTVYTALKGLQNDNIIMKIHNKSNSYELNMDKIEFIINVYQNKKA